MCWESDQANRPAEMEHSPTDLLHLISSGLEKHTETTPLANYVSRGFFKRFYLLVLERGEGREKERERNNNWLHFAHTLTGE